MNDDAVLYWAHHEKLCLVDGHIAFMGGLDLCYGRWDTNQHSIADAHPGDVNKIVFIGQDYNNSRIMDFEDVTNWRNNKLDRTQNSRMGWTDVSLSLTGPSVQDLQQHFCNRWNFIYDEKYLVRKDDRYCKLTVTGGYEKPPGGEDPAEDKRGLLEGEEGGLRDKLKHRIEGEIKEHGHHWGVQHRVAQQPTTGTGFSCQITRSLCKWSQGTSLEVSAIVSPGLKKLLTMDSTQLPMPIWTSSKTASILFTSKISSSLHQLPPSRRLLKTRLELPS
jgi:phospholipase D1/2